MSQYDAQADQIKRQQMIADALRQSGNEGIQYAPPSGNRAYRHSEWEGINKILQNVLGAYQGRKAEQAKTELDKQDQAHLGELIDSTKPSDLTYVDQVRGKYQAGDTPDVSIPSAVAGNAGIEADRQSGMRTAALKGLQYGGSSAPLASAMLERNLFPPPEKVDRVDLGNRIGVYKDGKFAGYETKGLSPDAAANLAASTENTRTGREFTAEQNKLARDQAATLANEQHNVTMRGQDLVNARAPSGSAGQKAADRETGTEVAKWLYAGGKANFNKNLTQLRSSAKQLADNTDNISGPLMGRMPDWSRAITNPESIKVQQDIEGAVQGSLREVLGAQYTQKEGENVFSRAFNPQLDEATNLTRVNRLLDALEQAKKAKDEAADYFETHDGSMAGYNGQTAFIEPDYSDISQPASGKPKSGKSAADRAKEMGL